MVLGYEGSLKSLPEALEIRGVRVKKEHAETRLLGLMIKSRSVGRCHGKLEKQENILPLQP